MTAHSNGAAVKAAGRDSALTWEVPPPLDDPQLQGRLPDIQRNFLEVARKHVDKLVVELLAAERVANAGDWAPLLSDLAHRAAALLSPTALRAAGNTDPRSYIKVKRVGASRAAAAVDSPLCPTGTVVDGVVCRKALAHKRMRTAIDNPRIVTLRGDLEYERPNDKLSSFDALMDSERQHLRSIVNALVAVQTDVLLVDGSVARVAQEMLLEAGVSLATHVKPALLTRIARCVGATVLPATAAVSAMSVGTCAAFEVTAAAEVEPGEGTAAAAAAASPRHEPSSSLEDAAVESVMSQPAVAPLMWFKGCSRGLGCTVIVEGTNAEQLAQAKRAATLAAYAAYWNRIEAAYLADQAVAAAACEGTSLHGHGGQLSTAPAISAAKTAERREREGTGPIFSASPYVSLYKEPQQHEGAVELAGGSAVPTFADAQSLWLSISCRNPAKGIQCEPPHLHSMPYYREGGEERVLCILNAYTLLSSKIAACISTLSVSCCFKNE